MSERAPAAEPSDANVTGMAVTVTLVFACESHREAWLRRTGILKSVPRERDYEHRCMNNNLTYSVGPEPAGVSE